MDAIRDSIIFFFDHMFLQGQVLHHSENFADNNKSFHLKFFKINSIQHYEILRCIILKN